MSAHTASGVALSRSRLLWHSHVSRAFSKLAPLGAASSLAPLGTLQSCLPASPLFSRRRAGLDEVLFPRTGAYSALTGAPRSFASSSSSSSEEEESLERDVLPYDVLIVGAGPAGLAAAIRTKQIAKDEELTN